MRAPGRLAALLTTLALLPACASTSDLDLGDPLDASATYLEMGRFEEAADLAGPLAANPRAGNEDRAEAAFLAGEAEFARGKHLKAFRHYRYILENASWSDHAGLIEDRLFEIGQAFFHDEQYGGWFGGRSRGVEVLETLQVHYRHSERADDALRLVGDHFADEQEWLEAALAYERLVNEYPESEWVERSLWMAGQCRRKNSRGPEYDRDELLRAKQQLELSLTRFPKGVAAKQVREELLEVRRSLALSELVVADFYAARGIPAGERLRLANAFMLYPDTEAGAVARERLVALGVDLASLKDNPLLTSLDALKPGRAPWGELSP